MDSRIDIKSLESLRKDVLPGDKFKILSKLILSADSPKNCELNFSLVGTNLKKETLKIPLDKKSLEIKPNKEESVAWEIEYPSNETRRFNFGGYLQWFLPDDKKSGIIFKNLFTAGSDYNIFIKDTKPVFDTNKRDSVSKFYVELENQEIDKLNLNVRIIVRDENEDEIMYLEKEVTINYIVKILFDLDITLKHLSNYQYKVICLIREKRIKETDWFDIFPVVKKPDYPLKIRLELPGITVNERNLEGLYLEPGERFNSETAEEYLNLKVLPMNSSDYIFKFKGIIVYGLRWEEELAKNPVLFDEFRNELFSYLFFTDIRTKDILPKEKKIWEANKLLMEYFIKVLKTKFSSEVQKLQIFLNRLDRLNEDVKNILENIDDIISTNLLPPSKYKILFEKKKDYYINYLSLKSDAGILTEKEEQKIHSLIDYMEKEKNYLKNLYSDKLKNYKELMEKRYRQADYYNNLEVIGIPEEIYISPKENFYIKGEIINNSRKNNLYFTVNIEPPTGFKLLSPKEKTFPFIAYKSQLVEINNFELRFQTPEVFSHKEDEVFMITFNPKTFK
ncbi:MAG: hypothetical protein PHV06_05410 [bacterium]|nr:hypothetical protein [bacterium]